MRTQAIGLTAVWLVLGCLLAQAQTWPKEPKGYRSVEFGALRIDVAARLKDAGFPQPAPITIINAPSTITWKTSIGKVEVTENWRFDDKDQVVKVDGAIPSETYSSIRDVFIEAYGEPLGREEDVKRNGFGVEFKGERLTWSGKNILVVLEQLGSTTTESSYHVMSQDYVHKLTDAKQKDAKSAAEGLR